MIHAVRLSARSLSFAIGVLSLGAETLWARTYSFLNQSTPKAVSIVLGAYLLGIALGAALGAALCKRQEKRLPEILGVALLFGSAAIVISPFFLAMTVKVEPAIIFMRIFPAGLAFLPACFSSVASLGLNPDAD